MSLQSQTFGGPGKTHTGVTIQSKKAGVFLCFNKRGRLVTRVSIGGSHLSAARTIDRHQEGNANKNWPEQYYLSSYFTYS